MQGKKHTEGRHTPFFRPTIAPFPYLSAPNQAKDYEDPGKNY